MKEEVSCTAHQSPGCSPFLCERSALICVGVGFFRKWSGVHLLLGACKCHWHQDLLCASLCSVGPSVIQHFRLDSRRNYIYLGFDIFPSEDPVSLYKFLEWWCDKYGKREGSKGQTRNLYNANSAQSLSERVCLSQWPLTEQTGKED
jgi:hypothetical protein